MFLSEAIKKRNKLEKEADEMEKWMLKQEFETKELKWWDMKKAVREVVDQKWQDWHKYNDAIEKDINQLDIEIK